MLRERATRPRQQSVSACYGSERRQPPFDPAMMTALLLYAYCNGVYSSRRILTYRHQLVASPSYLKTCKPPKEPRDLLDHRLLTFSHWKPENSWTFVHENGMDKETLTFQPHFSMNDYTGLAPALAAGAGIGDLPPVVQPRLIREGRLVEVIPD
jgi:DNA-binding transcriptional LysR family regulator